MPKYTRSDNAGAFCDRCGFKYRLGQLRELIVNKRRTNMKVCPSCYEPDHPQNYVDQVPKIDPQAVRNPRPDTTLVESRVIQWGWNPVGGGTGELTPNALQARGMIGQVSTTISGAWGEGTWSSQSWGK